MCEARLIPLGLPEDEYNEDELKKKRFSFDDLIMDVKSGRESPLLISIQIGIARASVKHWSLGNSVNILSWKSVVTSAIMGSFDMSVRHEVRNALKQRKMEKFTPIYEEELKNNPNKTTEICVVVSLLSFHPLVPSDKKTKLSLISSQLLKKEIEEEEAVRLCKAELEFFPELNKTFEDMLGKKGKERKKERNNKKKIKPL